MFSEIVCLNALVWMAVCLAGFAALYVAWYVLSWLFLWIVSRTVNMQKEYNQPSKFYTGLMYYGYDLICIISRVKYKGIGIDKIPFGTRFVLVSNHRSKFDNMVQSVAIHKENIAYLSKSENFTVPLGSRFIWASGYLKLVRGDIKSGIYNVNRAVAMIKGNYSSIGVFPEGTRSGDGSLLPFKPGCFKIVEKAKCPIVVGITRGTENIAKNWPLRSTKTSFEVVKVIMPEEYEGKKSTEISDMVYKIISDNL